MQTTTTPLQHPARDFATLNRRFADWVLESVASLVVQWRAALAALIVAHVLASFLLSINPASLVPLHAQLGRLCALLVLLCPLQPLALVAALHDRWAAIVFSPKGVGAGFVVGLVLGLVLGNGFFVLLNILSGAVLGGLLVRREGERARLLARYIRRLVLAFLCAWMPMIVILPVVAQWRAERLSKGLTFCFFVASEHSPRAYINAGSRLGWGTLPQITSRSDKVPRYHLLLLVGDPSRGWQQLNWSFTAMDFRDHVGSGLGPSARC